jgi:hypothetical protein
MGNFNRAVQPFLVQHNIIILSYIFENCGGPAGQILHAIFKAFISYCNTCALPPQPPYRSECDTINLLFRFSRSNNCDGTTEQIIRNNEFSRRTWVLLSTVTVGLRHRQIITQATFYGNSPVYTFAFKSKLIILTNKTAVSREHNFCQPKFKSKRSNRQDANHESRRCLLFQRE